MTWPLVTLGYVSYLATISFARPKFRKARWPLVVAFLLSWSLYANAEAIGALSSSGWAEQVVLPALVLIVCYWLSGLLFVEPNLGLEQWLRAVDERLVGQSGAIDWYRRVPAAMACLELSYLLVYVAVPAGAVALIAGGHGDQVDRFWTIVLTAELASYGMLPWLQTRPPRLLESSRASEIETPWPRRLNLAISGRASIQVNTIPSGHAAGAVATALAVCSTMPSVGAAFLVLAIGIAVASVLGRYHYTVDVLLGVLVAGLTFALVGRP